MAGLVLVAKAKLTSAEIIHRLFRRVLANNQAADSKGERQWDYRVLSCHRSIIAWLSLFFSAAD